VDQMSERKEWLGRGWAYPVLLDPRTGAVAFVESEADIRQSIMILLDTAPGERVMRPDFGCGIHDLAFEVIDTATLTRIETVVREALAKYEARIEVLRIEANPQDAEIGQLLIELEYRVRRTNQVRNLVYPFYFKEGGVSTSEGSRG